MSPFSTKHLGVLALLALAGCADTALTGGRVSGSAMPNASAADDPSAVRVQGTFSPVDSAGGVVNTFHHPQALDGAEVDDPREVLARGSEEGPIAYTTRLHGCRKMRYDTVGRMLADVGVDLAATEATSAGALYRRSDQAMGAPNYAARVPETIELTTASASRLFDVLVQAAPEVIANLGSVPRCQVAGTGVTLFDADGQCNADGLTCLLGEPATADHVALCNAALSESPTPEKGQVLAVAALLAAAATCE